MKLKDIIARLKLKIGGFTKFTFPKVRRIQPPGLIANELVSVQPMTLPVGSLFYLDYTYGSFYSLSNICKKVKEKYQPKVNRPKRKPGKRKPRR